MKTKKIITLTVKVECDTDLKVPELQSVLRSAVKDMPHINLKNVTVGLYSVTTENIYQL